MGSVLDKFRLTGVIHIPKDDLITTADRPEANGNTGLATASAIASRKRLPPISAPLTWPDFRSADMV
jgi:hypothetical protein